MDNVSWLVVAPPLGVGLLLYLAQAMRKPWVAVVVLAFIAPIYWLPGVSVELVSIVKDSILLSTVGGFAGVFLLRRARMLLPSRSLAILITLLLVFLLSGVVFSAAPKASSMLYLRCLLSIGVFIIAYNVLNSVNLVSKALRAILYIGIFSAAYALLAGLFGGHSSILPAVTSLGEQTKQVAFTYRRTAFSPQMAFTIPLLLGLGWNRLRRLKISSFLWLLGLVLVMAALFQSQGRAGMLAALVGISVFLFYVSKKLLVLFIVGILAIAILMPGALVQYGRLEGNLPDITAGRTYLWQKALNIAIKKPFTGIGLGQIPSASYKYAPFGTPPQWATGKGAHNQYLEIAATAGVLPGLLAVILVGLAGIRSLSLARSLKGTNNGLIAASLAGVIAAGVVDSLFESGILLGTFYMGITWWICFAAMERLRVLAAKQ